MFSELPFAYLSSDDLISLINSNNFNQSCKSFDPFTITDDKYNVDLDITQSCLRSRFLNVPRDDYIFLDTFSSLSTDDATTTTLFTMNIRSIPTNFQAFIDLVLTNTFMNLNILGFTETRLDNDLISLYQLPGYKMFNKCRNRNGGGVAIYVSTVYNSCMLIDFTFTEPYMECLGVESILANKKYLFICIYRPPNGNVESFLNGLNNIFSIANNYNYECIYVFGDLNIDLLKQDGCVFEFVNAMYSYSFFPLITKATRVTDTSATLIDHIWVTRTENNINNYILQTDITDHFPVVSQFTSCYLHKPEPVYITKRTITQAALETFINDLSEVGWNDVFESNCPDRSYNLFFNKFNHLFQKNFPERKIRVNPKHDYSPYVTPALRNSIKERNRLERLARKWPLTYGEMYRKFRNKLTSTLRAAKNKFYKDNLKVTQGDPKLHWRSINSLLGKNSQSANQHIELNPLCSDIANEFNDHFLTNNTSESIHNKDYLQYLNNPLLFSMYLPPTNNLEILNHLRSITTNTPGYDDIPPKILSHSSTLISTPLTYIINLTLKTGIFPSKLKTAKVIPIYKKGSRSDINNYRPISILSAFSKIFEKIISIRLKNYLEKNYILTDCQHGFRASRSTESAITQFTNSVYKCLEGNYYAVGVFIDLSKAFDTINHDILYDKLYHIGIRGVPLKLLQNYLTNRTQAVYCNSKYSLTKSISIGVPQGSILGPTLFLIYINDIINSTSKFQCTLYADDINCLMKDKDIHKLHADLTSELHQINHWIKLNKLRLNVSKTKYIVFQNRSVKNHIPPVLLEGESLNCVTHTKFLGIYIDENLNWRTHIDNVCMKLSRMCGILYKIRDQLPTEALLSIYYTLCYPYFIYCVSLWACTWPSFITKLKVIQNKILRCIFYMGKFDSTSAVYSEQKLLIFSDIHKCFVLLSIFKFMKVFPGNNLFNYVDSPYATRGANLNLECPQFRTVLFKHSLFYFGPHLWNSLPVNIKNVHNVSYLQFKRKIKEHFIQSRNS